MSNKNQVMGKVGQDPTLPNVSLILNGVERHLAFDFNAIVQAERHTGINLLKSVISEFSATNIRALLWAALLKENPELTIEEVGSWITMHNAVGIREAITIAWFGSVDESDDKAEDSGE